MAANKDKIRAAAQKYLQKGQVEKAIREYERLVEEDPKDVRTLLKIGDLQTRAGDQKNATETYGRVAQFYSDQGFFLKAVAVYKQILRLDASLVEINLKLADLYYQLGLMSDAANQYRQVSQIYEQEGRVKESVDILRKMVDLDPDNVASRIKLAESFAKQGQGSEAREHFQAAADYLKSHHRIDDYIKVAERVIHFDPSDLATTKELANIYIQKNDARRALAKLQVCFTADAKDTETLNLLATAFRALGQSAKTLSVYRELGRIYEAEGDSTAYLGVMRKILALAPEDPEATKALANSDSLPTNALGRIKPTRKAVAKTEVREINRTQEDSVSGAGTASSGLPSAPAPTESETPAAVHGPDADEAITRIMIEADVYIKYGLKAKAIEHIKKVFELQPRNREAREKFKDLLVDTGELDSAVAELMLLASHAKDNNDSDAAVGYLRELLRNAPQHGEARALMEQLAPYQADVDTATELKVGDVAKASTAADPVPSPIAYEPSEVAAEFDLDDGEELIVDVDAEELEVDLEVETEAGADEPGSEFDSRTVFSAPSQELLSEATAAPGELIVDEGDGDGDFADSSEDESTLDPAADETDLVLDAEAHFDDDGEILIDGAVAEVEVELHDEPDLLLGNDDREVEVDAVPETEIDLALGSDEDELLLDDGTAVGLELADGDESELIVDDGEEDVEPSIVVDDGEEDAEPSIIMDDGEEDAEPSFILDDGEDEAEPSIILDDGEDEAEPSIILDDGGEEVEPSIAFDDGDDDEFVLEAADDNELPLLPPSLGRSDASEEPVFGNFANDSEDNDVLDSGEKDEETRTRIAVSAGESEVHFGADSDAERRSSASIESKSESGETEVHFDSNAEHQSEVQEETARIRKRRPTVDEDLDALLASAVPSRPQKQEPSATPVQRDESTLASGDGSTAAHQEVVLDDDEAEETDFSGVADTAVPETVASPSASERDDDEDDVDLADELEEIGFFLEQGLEDEAREQLDALTAIYGNRSQFAELRAKLDGTEEASTETAVAADPEASRKDDSYDPLLGEDEAEPLMDFSAELSAELDELAASDDFQVAFQDVFDEFKKGVAEVVEEGDYETHYDLGIAYKEMGLLDDAIREFEQASQASAKAVGALTMMGLCSLAAGDTAQALSHFLKGLNSEAVTPDQSLALRFEIGQAYEQMGRFTEALKFFEMVHSLDATFRDVGTKLESVKENAERSVDPNAIDNELDELLTETDAEKAARSEKSDKISYL